MSRDRRPDDPIADFGTVDREADEPDRDDLGSLAAGDADWVTAAERATGRRLRPGVADDVTREFWGESPGWQSSGPVGRTGRRSTSGRTAAVTAGESDAGASAAGDEATAARGRLSRWTSGLRRPAPSVPPGGRVERTRTHRVVPSDDTRAPYDDVSEEQLPDLARADADRVGTPLAVELESAGPGRGGPRPPRPAPTFAERTGLDAVDPLIRRLGALLLIGVLIVPVALALRSPSTERDTAIRSLASGELADWLPISALGRTGRTADSGAAAGTTRGAAHGEASGVAGSTDGDRGAGGADGSDGGSGAGAGSSGDPGTVSSACEIDYTIGSGDYWLRLAEEADVALDQLLRANDATIETAIHPGDDVCLPAGADIPSPPPPSTADDGDEGDGSSRGPSDVTASQGGNTSAGDGSGSSGETASSAETTAPATTSAPTSAAPATTAPATTSPSTSAAPATAAPATTSPPDTTSPAVSANPSEEQVRAIIREVFPDDQHETAFKVARRESGFRADADNGWCCHGIFQIHWQAHRSWLNGRGITSVEQLYDARTNVELAFEIYERSGGWGPWSATAY